jgi:hypothetical protein
MSDLTASLFKDHLYNLEAFIDSGRGQVTIGAVKPVPCGALAAEGRKVLVALVRRDRESVFELLTRLDAALGRVAEENIVIDEVSAYIKPHRKPRS